MIKMEDWLTIRNLRERGYLIKRIARELKISRNTVKRALRKEPPPRYCRPPRVNSKIEPFHEAIVQMLSKDLIGTRGSSKRVEEIGIWRQPEARGSVFEYIEIFYNRIRKHSSSNYCSPAEFEKRERDA